MRHRVSDVMRSCVHDVLRQDTPRSCYRIGPRVLPNTASLHEASKQEKFELMDSEKAHYAIRRMARLLEMTKSGYYAWKKHRQTGPLKRARAQRSLDGHVAEIHAESDGVYGAPRGSSATGSTRRERGREDGRGITAQAGPRGDRSASVPTGDDTAWSGDSSHSGPRVGGHGKLPIGGQ